MTTGSDIDFTVSEENGRVVITPQGDWIVRTIGPMEKKLRSLEPLSGQVILDVTHLGA